MDDSRPVSLPLQSHPEEQYLCAMQPPDQKCSLPQPLGPDSIPSAVVCHTRGLTLECRRPAEADEHIVQMAFRGTTIFVLKDPPG